MTARADRFGLFRDVSREHGFEPLRVEGALPRELAGTLFRAGPGLLAWQGRLFGLVESSRPTELAPDSLATHGETDLGGVVLETFTAHPHPVAARNAIYGFGTRFGRAPALALYKLPASGVARRFGE